MKKSSKKAYQIVKEQKALEKEKKNKEFQQERAKIFKEIHEKDGRSKNSIWRKKLNWVIGCFQHLLENFSQIDKKVKEIMLEIQNTIISKHQEIESKINEVVETVKNFDDRITVQQIIRQNKMNGGTLNSTMLEKNE